jgi:transcriptional regulator with XRE-family HTH domain
MDTARFPEAEQERKNAPAEFCEWFHRGLKQRGRGAGNELAKLLGIRPELVSRMRYGQRPPRAHELRIIEAYLGGSAPLGIATGPIGVGVDIAVRVRVIGNLVGGSKVILLDGKLDEVVIPEPIPFKTMAIEVRGDSLGGLFDRWLLFYDDVRVPPAALHDLHDRLCVIGLQDETVVQKLRNIKALDGKPILWAAAVKQLVQKIAT